MKLETFCSTLGYMPLQRHLLAVPTHTLEDAVRAGNEFLQIKPGGEKGNTSVRQIGDGEEETLSTTDKVLASLAQAMRQLAEKVGTLQDQPRRPTRKDASSNQQLCWECGQGATSDGTAPVKRDPHQTKRSRETDKARNSSTPSCLQSVI